MKLAPKWHQTGIKLAWKWHQTSIKVAPKWHQTSIKVAHQGCKFAANLHQTCTPSFVFFCYFFLFFNMFFVFYMFLFMWFIVFLWKPFGISGQQMDYNSMCPGFLNTIYIYIYIIWLPQHYFPNQKVTCISNMWVENAQWQLPTQAPNSIFFKNIYIYIYFF